MIDINEGRSGALALPGFVLVIAAILFIFISPVVSVVLVPIASCCFLVSTGIELDPATKCYRPYYGLFSLKMGAWNRFVPAQKVKLVLAIEQYGVTNWTRSGNSANNRSVEKTITYNIELETEKGDVELFDFFSYKDAVKTMTGIGQILQIETEDQVQEIIENRKSRMFERRRLRRR